MLSKFIKGINIKSFTITTLVVFVVMMVSDYLFHEIMMKGSYIETASLWRTPEDMQRHFLYMLLGQVILAKIFTLLFVKGYEGTGLGEGVRFGFYMGWLHVGYALIQYATTPLTTTIFWGWVGYGFAQMILLGATAACIYKK